MKITRTLSLALISLLLLGTLSACGTPAAGGGPKQLSLATGGVSGTYYPFGGAMAQIWNTKIDKMNVTPQSTGATKENLELLNKGEVEIAIVQNDVMDYAFNGTNLFAGNKLTNIASVASLYPEVVQIAVSPESGIQSIAELKGKRVSVGDAGSGTEFNAAQILEVYGLAFTDITKSNLSFKESGEGLQNGTLDACFVTAGVPNSALMELSASKELLLVPIDQEHMDALMAKYPYYAPTTIPGGTYPGTDAETLAASVRATLAVKKDLDEDTVYNLTKALFDNQKELATAHKKGEELSLDTALSGISVPLHPGAAKYFTEKGLDVAGK